MGTLVTGHCLPVRRTTLAGGPVRIRQLTEKARSLRPPSIGYFLTMCTWITCVQCHGYQQAC